MGETYTLVKVSDLEKLKPASSGVRALLLKALTGPVVVRSKMGKAFVFKQIEPHYKGFRILNPHSREAKKIDAVIARTNKAGTWLDDSVVRSHLHKKHA